MSKLTFQQKRLDSVHIIQDMQQHWTKNAYEQTYTDQFGFSIHWGSNGNRYHLEHKGAPVLSDDLNTLSAAKEISKVLLNDKVYSD